MTVLMAWAASTWEVISSQGPGAVVFTAVGAACVIMLTLSAVAVAWRWFRPLPAVPTPNPFGEPPSLEFTPREQIEGLEVLRDTVDAVAKTLRDQQEATELSSDDVATRLEELAATIKEVSDQNAALRGSVQQSMESSNRALSSALYFAIGGTNLLRIGILIDDVPTAPSGLNGDWYLNARKFLNRLKWYEIGGDRLFTLRSHLETAKWEIEVELRSPNSPSPPDGVSVHDWREWLIAERQCSAAVKYLMAARRSLEDDIANHRGNLVELYDALNPQQR